MKIALISSFWDPIIGGGTAVVTRELAYGLQTLGYKVTVITTHHHKKTTVDNENGLKIYRFFPKNLYWIGDKYNQPLVKRLIWHLIDIWNPHAYLKVRQIINKENPDIVHTHKLQGMSSSIWLTAGQASVKKIVHTSHDYELFIPEGTLQPKINQWAKKRPVPVRLLQSIGTSASKKVNIFTSPSQYVLDLHLKRGLFVNAYSQVVHNSHRFTTKDIQQHQKRMYCSRKPKKETTRFLFIGRFDRNKGIDILCEAFQTCTKTFSNIRLDLLGNGGMFFKLQQKYHENSQIHFHGYKSGMEKENFLFHCDVVIIPSVWEEPFGIVLAESFSYGKPVIATSVGGIPEIVKDGETGILIPSGDTEALAQAIGRVATSPDKIRRMAGACFERSKSYTVDEMLASYDLLYQKVFSQNADMGS